jgi:hypothetical protein
MTLDIDLLTSYQENQPTRGLTIGSQPHTQGLGCQKILMARDTLVI